MGTAAAWLAMWTAMMAAMMLPSLVPMLRPVTALTALVAAGYFAVWTLAGLAAYALELAGPGPMAAAALVIAGGLLQSSDWKARHLACCRARPALPAAADAAGAWRHGLRLGGHCACSCAGLTAALLALGMMDAMPMALVTAAITAERLAPGGERTARAVGSIVVAVGVVMAVKALP